MSNSFDWHSFRESVEALCRQVEHRVQLSDSNTLQDFLFRLQAKRTACERLIGAAVASGVDTSVSENVQGNVKRLSNVIQHLIDDVERQLQSVDSTFYSSSIFSETLVHRNGSVGRPKLVINLTQIDYLRSWQFTWTRICHTLCVSRTTLWRRLKEVNYNFRESRFTIISDIDLQQQVAGIKAEFENTGERMVIGILRSRGIHVPRHRVRDIIRRIDPINTALRWRAMHPKYQYDVPGPNALWRIDGLHKLIHWGFVVHGGIDSFSRLVVFLKCAMNNRAETVMFTFIEGTRRNGIPLRVRSDHGGKMMMSADSWSQLGGEIEVHIYKVRLCTISVLRGCTGTLHSVVYLAFTRCSTTWRTTGFSISLMTQMFSAFTTHLFHASIEHWKDFARAGITIA